MRSSHALEFVFSLHVLLLYCICLPNVKFEADGVLTMNLVYSRGFTSHLGISVLNVRLKAFVKLHFIRLGS